MGFCTRRYFFLSICLLQMISVVQRQVFDFLGFLWIPILANFFEIIFIIFGFFGAYQYRPKYIIAYLLWHIFWLVWNIFIICLYLNVAGFDHEKNTVLKLDHSSDSWWKKEGPGCKVKNVDAVPAEYEGCLVDYVYVEIFQAGLQCSFALFNSIISICLCRTFSEEDDTFNFEKPDGPTNFLLHPMYVSSSDNLHDSNKHINTTATPKRHLHLAFTNNLRHSNEQQQRQRFKRSNNRQVCADTIRHPYRRSNSFNSLTMITRKGSIRPKSLCSDAYFDH